MYYYMAKLESQAKPWTSQNSQCTPCQGAQLLGSGYHLTSLGLVNVGKVGGIQEQSWSSDNSTVRLAIVNGEIQTRTLPIAPP